MPLLLPFSINLILVLVLEWDYYSTETIVFTDAVVKCTRLFTNKQLQLMMSLALYSPPCLLLLFYSWLSYMSSISSCGIGFRGYDIYIILLVLLLLLLIKFMLLSFYASTLLLLFIMDGFVKNYLVFLF